MTYKHGHGLKHYDALDYQHRCYHSPILYCRFDSCGSTSLTFFYHVVVETTAYHGVPLTQLVS